jgi:hypothetical protein
VPGLDPDAFRKLTGKTLDSLKSAESLGRIQAKLRAELRSSYPVITLGSSADAHTFLTEEQRASHWHVIGSTREGKSKLIEHLVRHNIRHGHGATVLDPTANGQTAKDILAHCADVGYTKVIYIDPHDHSTCLPTFNPLRVPLNDKGQPKAVPTDARAELLMAGLRVLWGGGEFWQTPTIEKNLKHLIVVLIKAQASLSDAACFCERGVPVVDARRRAILDRVDGRDRSRLAIEAIFAKPPAMLEKELGTSLSRLSSFLSFLPSLMYGSTASPVDYVELVRDGWLVLVNLDPINVWGEPQQVALGTLVIAELISAMHTLFGAGWRGRHYLYMDEAGRFTSPLLAETMSLYGKLGLWVTIAHQSYRQFRDRDVLGTIETACSTKVMFNLPGSEDRGRMMRDLFSGTIPENLEHWVSVLQKQHAIIKIQKNDAAVLKVEEVRPAKATPDEVEAFKKNIYASNSFYRTKEAIDEEIRNRFVRPQGKQVPKPAARAPGPPAGDPQPHSEPKEKERDPSQDSGRARGGAAFDGVPDSAPLLPKKARRQRPEGTAPKRP